jgi:phosphoribosylglycinamide formyltransferase-1
MYGGPCLMQKFVVLISGSGSNLQAIIDAVAGRRLRAQIVGVLSNKADAYGLTRAQTAGIPTAVISHRDYADRDAFDRAMMKQIDAWEADVVVLAGFMRILTPDFVNHFDGRLLNIHPSLLPKYKGLHTHQRALDSSDTEHGCSIHLVNAALDDGPVVAQAIVSILPDDDEASLTERVHKSEHKLYPLVLGWMADRRLLVKDGKPWLDGALLEQPVCLRF